MPHSRRRTLLALSSALAAGEVRLGPGEDWAGARADLAALPGIGPWSVEVVPMRGLGDPDAFPAGDLGVRAGLRSLGLERRVPTPDGRARSGVPGVPTPCSTSGPPATMPSTACPADPAGDPAASTGAIDDHPRPTPTATTAVGTRRHLVLQDTPVGPLTLVAEDGALVGVWMEDQRHHPGDAAHGSERPAPTTRSCCWWRRPAAGVLRGRADGVRPAAGTAGHRVPAPRVGRARGDPLRRDDVLR